MSLEKIEWTRAGITAINEIKKSILRKKIILNIIIESYAKHDRIFRYIHMFLALTAPIISFIGQMSVGSTDQTSTSSLIISSIVAGMIKLKDFLKYDKTKELAKQQVIKYGQLLQRIDHEMRKPSTKRQNEEEFLYWINREFASLEVSDPDLPHRLKNKYIDLCKEKGIPYDEDINMLSIMINTLPSEKTADLITSKSECKVTDKSECKVTDESECKVNDKSECKVNDKSECKVNDNLDSDLNHNKSIYQENLRTHDPSKDLQWAIDRLSTLDD